MAPMTIRQKTTSANRTRLSPRLLSGRAAGTPLVGETVSEFRTQLSQTVSTLDSARVVMTSMPHVQRIQHGVSRSPSTLRPIRSGYIDCARSFA